MSKNTITEDIDRMEQIMIRLETTKDEIWQNRYIYWIAKAIYDLLCKDIKRNDHN